MSHSLGLNISLPSGTLSKLKASRSSKQVDSWTNEGEKYDESEKINNEKQFFVPSKKLSPLHGDESDSDNEDQWESYGENVDMIQDNSQADGDDKMIMPFVPSGFDSDDSNESGSEDGGERSENDDSLQSDQDSLDDISLTPPISLPLLAVELDKLCGYTPSDEHEAKRLADELCEALLGVKGSEAEVGEAGSKSKQNDRNDDLYEGYSYGDGLSLNFTSRAVELLEAGVAYHSDTLQRDTIIANEDSDEKKLNHAFVPYPEFMQLPASQCDDDEPSIMATTKIWKRILYPHDIPVVHRLLQLLSKCSRSLMWKYEMALEIRKIVKEERRWNEERKRQRELKIWRREKRPDELAKLYEVRETFVMKLDMVREKYEYYVKEREDRVQRELLRRKEKGIGNGGISGLDWDGKITFAFDDDVEEIVQKMMYEKRKVEADSNSIDYDSADNYSDDLHDDGYDCDSDDYESCQQLIKQPRNAGLDSNLDRKKRRAKAAAKRLRRKLDAEKERAREEELRLKVVAAHDEEERIREMCTSTDEKLAVVMVTNLQKRVEKIDDLLDSLQMDAWKDEEEGILDGDSSHDEKDFEKPSDRDEEEKMTLLDSILAMILGTLHQPKAISPQHHFNFIKQEHDSIIEEWKLAFGRLPKLSITDPTRQKKKYSVSDDCWSDGYASSDNDESSEDPRRSIFGSEVPDDWEDEADDCDIMTPLIDSVKIQLPQSHEKPMLVESTLSKKVSPNNDSSLSLPRKHGLRPGGNVLSK